MSATPEDIRKVFKAYDVRATYPDNLNEEIAWRIGYAAASFLLSSLRGMDRGDAKSSTVVVGHDMRKSSPAMVAALIEGIRSAGANVKDIGMTDTPQIYFGANHFDACGGIQTTASHNPAHYNGFKICGRGGKPVGVDTGLNDICRIACNVTVHEPPEKGSVRKADLTKPYRDFILGFLEAPRKLQIAIDASNGMAGKWVPLIFDGVEDIKILQLNFTHDGEFVHEPNPLVDANLKQLRNKVKRTQTDFGVCFDGDADRLMLVDENGDIVRCDLITALLAKYFLRRHPESTIVYDLRSSRVVKEEIAAAGGTPRRERVGHAFMKKALAETKAVFGGELSGHFYFKDNWYCDSGMLALVHVINVLTKENKPLSKLIAPLKRFCASGERNFENEKKDETIRRLADLHDKAQVDFLDGVTVQYEDWWCNVRKSNTEPLLRLNLEANTNKLMEDKLEEVAAVLGKPVDH